MYIYMNDRIMPASEAKVSVYDRGFLYGDGVFETMRAYDSIVFMIEEHIERLFRSASMIRLNIGMNKKKIKKSVYETLSANSLKNAYIRLTVSRGHCPIGLDPDLCKNPTFIIIAEKFRAYPEKYYKKGVKTIISETRRNLSLAIDPKIKSLNFLNNILAKIEAKEKGAYEALMLNSKGHLAEGSISNIFFMTNRGVLCTPSLECGILDGITRNIVLKLASENKIKIKEGKFLKKDLYKASEVFITNTTMEIMPVCKVDNILYDVGDTTRLLHEAYKAKVKEYIRDRLD